MESMTAHGYVDAYLVDPSGGRTQAVKGANTLLYWCADAVAHMFAGVTEYVPVTVGFVCAPASSEDLADGHFHFTDGDRTTKRQEDLIDASVLTVHDVRIGQNRQFSATETTGSVSIEGRGYSANKVTLGAMTTDNGTAEDIYGFLLKDSEGRVLAVKRLSSKVTRAKDYALAVSWSVTFN